MLLDQLLFLVVAALVLLGPGLLLAGALGLHRSIPPVLVLPVALLIGQVVVTVGTLLRLALHLPIDALAAWLVLVAANSAAWWWRSARAPAPHAAAAAVEVSGRATGADAETSTRGRERQLHRTGLGLPLAWLAAIGFIVGAQLKSDTLWHAAYSLKLVETADPSFSNLGIQTAGLIPSYLVPTWHDTVALAAWASATPPHVAYWLLPTLLLPLGALAIAGLARIATGRMVAEPLAALAYLGVSIADGAPRFAVADTASYPSHVVTEIAIPVAIAGWLMVLWSADRLEHRAGWALLGAGLVVTVVLHGNYTPWLALGIAGYLAGWAIVRAWPRVTVARHARAAGALLGMATVLLGLMLIGWKSSPQLGRGANEAAVESVQETFAGTFIGGTQSYRLDPAVLVPTGGIALLALLVLPLVAWRLRRLPGAWYVAGTMALGIAASQSTWLVPRIVSGGSTSVIARLGDGLPHALSVTLALVVLAQLFGGDRRGAGLALRVGAAGVIAVALVAVMYRLPPDPTLLPGGVVLLAGALLFALGGVAVVQRVRGRVAGGGAGDDGRVDSGTSSTVAATAGIGVLGPIPLQGAVLSWLALAGACLVMGAAGAGEVRAEWGRWAETSGGWSTRSPENPIGRLPNHHPDGRHPQLLADMGALPGRIPEGALVAAPARVVYFVAATEPVRVVVDDISPFDRESNESAVQRAAKIRSSKACWVLLPPEPIGASIGRIFATRTRSPWNARLVATGPAVSGSARWQLWTFC